MRPQGQQQGRGDGGEESLPARQQQGFRDLGFPGTRIGQLLDQFFGPLAPPFGTMLGQHGAGWPAVDVEEDDQSYCVCMEIPGVRREDLDIEIQNEVVTVRGEKRRSEKGSRPRWSERSYGAFVRSFSLPPDADPDETSASFQDGVLTLTFPKREQARPRRIEIQGASGDGSGEERSGESGSSDEHEQAPAGG